MRLIDADELKVDYIVPSTSTNTSCYRYVSKEQIDNAPTIDPVRHGTWLKYPGDIVSDDGLWGETLYDCSECGHTRHVATEFCSKCGAKMEQDGEIQVRWKSELISRQATDELNCCPNCGAKMEG